MATAKKTEDAKKVVKATPADLVAKVEASKKAAHLGAIGAKRHHSVCFNR